MLTTVHDQFKAALVKHREVSKDRAQILADGRVYAGQDALAEQLWMNGGLYEAVKYAGTLVNLEDPKIIYPTEESKIKFNHLEQWLNPCHLFSLVAGEGQHSINETVI